jgi:hypothetical protein
MFICYRQKEEGLGVGLVGRDQRKTRREILGLRYLKIWLHWLHRKITFIYKGLYI